jgi:hypothetical protein
MKAKAAFPSLNIKMHNNIFLKNLTEDIGKCHRIMDSNNPGSKKMVLDAVTACNRANVYLLI